jgi:hypothetical protein
MVTEKVVTELLPDRAESRVLLSDSQFRCKWKRSVLNAAAGTPEDPP